MSSFTPETPGLFASSDSVQQAQQAANRWADKQPDPARAAADIRELRQRVLLRSAVLWAVVGIPLLFGIVAILLSALGGAFLRSWLRSGMDGVGGIGVP